MLITDRKNGTSRRGDRVLFEHPVACCLTMYRSHGSDNLIVRSVEVRAASPDGERELTVELGLDELEYLLAAARDVEVRRHLSYGEQLAAASVE